jgi:hypothetical protein
MKLLILLSTLLIISSSAFAQGIRYKVSVSVDVNFNTTKDIIYFDHGNQINIKANPEQMIKFSHCVESSESNEARGSILGSYGKFEATRLTATLNRLKNLSSSQIGFKVRKKTKDNAFWTKNCPDTDYIFMTPKVFVTDNRIESTTYLSREMCVMDARETINACLALLDESDDGVCDSPNRSEMGNYFKLRKVNGWNLLSPTLKRF